eukprot:SAG22_NODE_4249_length_1325_cov_9.808632_1_plen_287_part_00
MPQMMFTNEAAMDVPPTTESYGAVAPAAAPAAAVAETDGGAAAEQDTQEYMYGEQGEQAWESGPQFDTSLLYTGRPPEPCVSADCTSSFSTTVSVYLLATLASTWLLYFSPAAPLVGPALAALLTAALPSLLIVGLLCALYSDALDRHQVVWSALLAIMWMVPLLACHTVSYGLGLDEALYRLDPACARCMARPLCSDECMLYDGVAPNGMPVPEASEVLGLCLPPDSAAATGCIGGQGCRALDDPGVCDDGGLGATSGCCAFGTDCADCGPRDNKVRCVCVGACH